MWQRLVSANYFHLIHPSAIDSFTHLGGRYGPSGCQSAPLATRNRSSSMFDSSWHSPSRSSGITFMSRYSRTPAGYQADGYTYQKAHI